MAYALIDADDAERCAEYRWHTNRGYVKTNAMRPDGKRRTLPLHRFILGLEWGDRRDVDHINGDPLDNRKANLRALSRAEHQLQHVRPHGSSRYIGVSWNKHYERWIAFAPSSRRKRPFIGYFLDEDEAAAAVRPHREGLPLTRW